MSSPVMITFPALKSSELSKDFVRDRSEFEITMKGRKRRLDHLSWEEKLQRKKLKNRVAAQTSRDRKKVKMDEMEITIQELMERNEVLLSECQSLRDMNKKLSADNVDLRKQFSGACSQCGCGQNRPVDCNISHGSAAGTNNAIGSCSQPQTPDYISRFENCSDISIVPDIFADLDTELDIDKLEEFAQSLLQDITADMEASSAQKQITASNMQQDNSRKVVGASSKQLESGRGESIVPKIENFSDQLHAEIEMKHTIEPELEEIIYTSVNDSDNCITIVVSNEVDIPISEVEMEIVTSSEETEPTINLAEYVSSYKVDADEGIEDTGLTLHDYLKPDEIEAVHSDCGYESLDSPHSESNDVEMSELWNQSFTELFPNLM